ncbi:MAG: phosphotransferase family protein [Actinomycetota bacterium]|nr:phosphotransferase family protein [Actinomycetota bacterium]
MTLVDPERLAAWMDGEGLAPGAPLTVERITTGHSNEVFVVERGELRCALRRPPRTPLSPTAHDMVREHRLLSAFRAPDGWHGREPVPVPRPVALCADPDVIGAPFYLMDVVDGVVVRDRLPEVLTPDPAACAYELIDALAGIHAFDWQAGGLGDFGRPDGYLERQVPRWLGQLERYKTRELPEVDEAGRWLSEHTPAMQPPTVIHGDYKLDNVMFAPDLPVCLAAVVDWEQSTVGDPLADVGWVIGLWVDPDEAASMTGPGPLGSAAPTRTELVERYGAATGRDLDHLAFYCVLGLFKLACVMEGSYARFTAGTSDDAYFAALGEGVPALARRALEFAEGKRF